MWSDCECPLLKLFTQNIIGGSIFLLSAGVSILVTGFGAAFLSYLAHYKGDNWGLKLLVNLLHPIATSNTLWGANLIASIAISVNALLYVSTPLWLPTYNFL